MKIKNNKKYRLSIGYDRLIIPGPPVVVTAQELRAALNDDMARCRRRFKRACMKSKQGFDNKNKYYITITADRADHVLWGSWTVEELC